MEMRELNEQRVCEILNEIIELEMAGVVRYAHSSLMVTGPNRIPIVAFLQEQATESLDHALQAGEYITGMDARIGYPNEHLAGDSDEDLSSPSYATAVGLLMQGLENHSKEERVQEEGDISEKNKEEFTEQELEVKPKIKKKSFFDKFTDGLKEFLDNAE